MSRSAQSDISLPVAVMLAFVRCYQLAVSPYLPGTCRYLPTCSDYAIEALQKHGWARGLILTAWRLLRCHPFAKGRCDPVPDKPTQRER